MERSTEGSEVTVAVLASELQEEGPVHGLAATRRDSVTF